MFPAAWRSMQYARVYTGGVPKGERIELGLEVGEAENIGSASLCEARIQLGDGAMHETCVDTEGPTGCRL